jgi:hypothetical protein
MIVHVGRLIGLARAQAMYLGLEAGSRGAGRWMS